MEWQENIIIYELKKKIGLNAVHLYSIQRWSLKSPEELWTPRVSAAVIEHNDPAVHQESSLMEGNNRHQQDLFNGCFAYIHFKTVSTCYIISAPYFFIFFIFGC